MQAPRIPSFFKTLKTKTFDYKPRYWNKRKEHLEELKKEGKKQKGFFLRKKLSSKSFSVSISDSLGKNSKSIKEVGKCYRWVHRGVKNWPVTSVSESNCKQICQKCCRYLHKKTENQSKG